MAGYEVILTPGAAAELEVLSPDVALRIGRKLQELKSSPFPRGDTVKRLHGYHRPLYRLRIGDYRALFIIEGARVVVLRIIHRSELERCLRDLF